MILHQINYITDVSNSPLSKFLIGLRLIGDDCGWFQWVSWVVPGGFCMVFVGQLL